MNDIETPEGFDGLDLTPVDTDEAPEQKETILDDRIVVELDDDGEAEQGDEGSAVLRTLREENRKKARRIAELEAQNAPKPVELGPRPKLSDFDFDEDRHEAALDEWLALKAKAEQQAAAIEQEARQAAEVWNKIESKYRTAAAAINVPNFEAKERVVGEALPEVVLKGVKAYCADPAKVVAVLGTNRDLLDKLSEEPDPIRALITLVKMEDRMDIRRKPKTDIDTPVKGTAPVSAASSDKVLEKLEREADRTGDRTAVIRYKRQLREKASA